MTTQGEKQPSIDTSKGMPPSSKFEAHLPRKLTESLRTIGRFRGWKSWQLWAAILVFASGGIGFTATSALLKLPSNPNCLRIFWPFASASMRLYCAQIEAESGTVDGLLKAIELVAALPEDHPLHQEINRNVEQWAVQILELAEKDFQEGKLEGAIAIARKIPSQVSAYDLVEKRIEKWQSTWAEGEKIFAEVEQQLRSSEWNQAFREAVQLLYLDNQYWATTKYEEVVKKIQLAQEESKQLDTAFAVLRRGGIDNWIQAITEASKIKPESYAYQEAQNIIDKAKDKLLAAIQDLIDNRNWQALSEVVERLPANVALPDEVKGWRTLANAGSDANEGTVESLENAIATAQQLKSDSPLYDTAQDLIARWKLEIEGVANLSKARETARTGTVNDLNAAIAQADLVAPSNPRYQEAQSEISGWNRQVQTIEDRPILEKAKELSMSGTATALQEAIAQASLINSNRALYREAQQEISRWQGDIERQEDQPFLDQAIALANAKDYTAAIDAAQQIQRGRALYREARSKIRRWRREIQAQKDLQEAYLIADTRTPEAIISALNILRKIPASTDAKEQSSSALNMWSYQLLMMAKDRANNTSLQDAIQLASMIPADSGAYASAQAQMAVWRKMLAPQPSAPVIETNFANPTPAPGN
jgi:hypothetical protein